MWITAVCNPALGVELWRRRRTACMLYSTCGNGPVISAMSDECSPLCCRASPMENTTSPETCLLPLSAIATSVLCSMASCRDARRRWLVCGAM